MSAIKKMNAYFVARKKLTLFLLWLYFAIALGYALTAMFLVPTLNFWLMLIPAVICLYFRLMYAKASYDPRKDRTSSEYVPYKKREEYLNKQKRYAHKKKRK